MEKLKGCIVMSLAGRDRGRLFLVTEDTDELFVLLADGQLRRLEKPKTKKRKHVKFFAATPVQLAEKLVDGGQLTNAWLRKVIKELSVDLTKTTTPEEG